jgi:hypothetical protein
VERRPRSIESGNVGVDFGSASDDFGQDVPNLFDIPCLCFPVGQL